MEVCVNRELDGGEFPDLRMKARGQGSQRPGGKSGEYATGPCQDWATTKATNRFVSNPRVDEGVIVAWHFLEELAKYYGITHRVEFRGHASDVRGTWRDNHLLLLPSWCEGGRLRWSRR